MPTLEVCSKPRRKSHSRIWLHKQRAVRDKRGVVGTEKHGISLANYCEQTFQGLHSEQ
jgi:hypothetical protein